MQHRELFRRFFLLAAIYDLVLGVAFFFFYPVLYALLGITMPTEPAYLHAAAAFVFVQGVMYLLVYRDMERNWDLVLVGAVYKLAYSGVAFYHLANGTLPHPVFALFGFLDLGFLVGFIAFMRTFPRQPGTVKP